MFRQPRRSGGSRRSSGDGDLRLAHTDPLGEPHSPDLEGGPFLRSIKQNSRRLEQVRSEEPVAPA